MGHRFASLVLAAVLLPGTAAPSAAIQIDSVQVPIDLALALLGGSEPDTRILVGGIPAEAESLITPGPRDRVVGSLVGEAGGTVVLEVAGRASEALSRYTEHLEQQGWSRATMPRDQRGGFQTTSPFVQDTWCGDEYSIVGSTAAPDESYVRIHYTRRDAGRTLCDVGELYTAGRDRPTSLQLPTLDPPPGALVRAGGGGGSETSVETEATIVSELDIESIFDHYAAQLAAGSWVPAGQAMAEGIVVGRWRTQDAEGASAMGSLSIWMLVDPDSYVAVLRLDRPEQR